jgi:NAD(P)-dependent dehydrogenase (short-subunit alcohol dehydrogenase family)
MAARALQGTVAVVTGASRGCGRGIAAALGDHGATVYVTGRTTREQPRSRAETIDETAEIVTERGGEGIAHQCDHTVDEEIEALFTRVREDQGRLDLLVNNAWGGYEDFGAAPFEGAFWKQPLWRWDRMFTAGLRAQMVTTRLGISLLLERQRGLVVNTTVAVGSRFLSNVFYDTVKTAVNRMAFGMAEDLRDQGVAVVALAPGWMRTEIVMESNPGPDLLEKTESVEYTGRAVGALAADANVMRWSGKMVETGALAREYGFTDVDGLQVAPFTELFPEYR